MLVYQNFYKWPQKLKSVYIYFFKENGHHNVLFLKNQIGYKYKITFHYFFKYIESLKIDMAHMNSPSIEKCIVYARHLTVS